MTPETKVKLIRYSVIGGVILLIVGAVVLVIHSLHGKGGGGGGDNPTPPSKTPCGRNQPGFCPDGQVCQPTQGGCITPGGGACTTNADCSNHGTCHTETSTGGPGACVCDPHYLPPNCLRVCDAEHKCSNGGTCTDSGTCNCGTAIGPQGQRYTGPVCDTPIKPDSCSTDNCKLPGCDAAKCKSNPNEPCNDGYVNVKADAPRLCTACAPNRGPGYNQDGGCSKEWGTRTIRTLNCPYNNDESITCATDPCACSQLLYQRTR